jgi:hypothetical protein
MDITKQQWIDQAGAACDEAIQAMATAGMFWADKEGTNREALINFMHTLYQGTDWRGRPDWVNSARWAAGITQANLNGDVFRKKPTAEEHAQELGRKDREAGRARREVWSPSMTIEQEEEACKQLKGMYDDLTGQSKPVEKPRELTPAELIKPFPLDSEPETWTKEVRRAFKSLPIPALKYWIARRQETIWKDKYGSDFKPTSGSVRG